MFHVSEQSITLRESYLYEKMIELLNDLNSFIASTMKKGKAFRLDFIHSRIVISFFLQVHRKLVKKELMRALSRDQTCLQFCFDIWSTFFYNGPTLAVSIVRELYCLVQYCLQLSIPTNYFRCAVDLCRYHQSLFVVFLHYLRCRQITSMNVKIFSDP